jgi:hypothetical protein
MTKSNLIYDAMVISRPRILDDEKNVGAMTETGCQG